MARKLKPGISAGDLCLVLSARQPMNNNKLVTAVEFVGLPPESGVEGFKRVRWRYEDWWQVDRKVILLFGTEQRNRIPRVTTYLRAAWLYPLGDSPGSVVTRYNFLWRQQ